MPPFKRLVVSLMAALTLAACSTDAFVDTRREAGQVERVGESTPDRVAICHGLRTPQDVLTSMASRECARTNRTPEYAGTAKWQCTLNTPHRSYFVCR